MDRVLDAASDAGTIMLPMFTAALMLFMGEERQRLKLGMNILSTTVGLLLVIMLLGWTNQSGATATMAVYLPGNWQAPLALRWHWTDSAR